MAWESVGRALRRVDPERFARLLYVARAVVDVHLGLGVVPDAIPAPVDLESSADVC